MARLAHIVPAGEQNNIVELGIIGGVAVDRGDVCINLAVGSESQARDLVAVVVPAIQALPDVKTARVIPTMKRSVAMTSTAKPARLSSPPPTLPEGVAAALAVASGKGGVGKSTVTINLALALAARGLRIAVLDADIYGPSLPLLLGLNEKPRLVDHRIQPLEAYGLSCMSIGLLLDEGRAAIWRGPMIASATRRMLVDVKWGEVDILLIDLPPGTGDVPLSLVQQTPLAGVVIVSTPQDLALLDVRRAITMFNCLKVKVVGIIENMSYFLCPSCGKRADIFDHGGAREEAKRLDLPFLGSIPLEKGIRVSADNGKPYLVDQPGGESQQAFLTIAEHVLHSLDRC